MTDFDVGEDEIIRTIRFITDLQVGATVTGSSSSAPFISLSVTVLLCAPFYIGSSCEIFNHCESNAVTCSDRGTCVNGFNGFTCNCNPPYIGANCERENFCINRNCNGRGTCNNGVDSYTCVCEPGYTGADCEDDINGCMNRNCSGNGVRVWCQLVQL